MNKIILTTALFSLAACQSVRPNYHASEDVPLYKLSDCRDITGELQKAEYRIRSLETQKRDNVGNSAANAGLAILMLNPFGLINTGRTGEVSKAIESYQTRITELKKMQAQCQNSVAAQTPAAE